MRKAFSNITVILALPLRLLAKSKIDNFVGGLIIGALFSLLVNVVTNQIGEDISRQKSLEALEIEIINHHEANAGMYTYFNSGNYKKGEIHNYFVRGYKTNVWDSLASTTFFYSLDPNTQGELLSYYTVIVEQENLSLANDNKIIQDYYSSFLKCSFEKTDCSREKDLYNKSVEFFAQQEANIAVFVDEYDSNLLKVFHPTKDRLKNPVLSVLMGRQAIPALILPWKQSTKPNK